MEKRGMDSKTKILFHEDWLRQWQKDPFNTFPIYVEVSPTGQCNHRCTFCAFDYVGYKKRLLAEDVLTDRLREMGTLGVKAVQFAGEGEPLLYSKLSDIMLATHEAGLDISMLTNAVLLKPEFVDRTIHAITWFQASINAGTAETYHEVHRVNPRDFDKALANMKYAMQVKRARGLSCEIGAQMTLIAANWHEAPLLAERLKDVGIDYLTLKPYSHHKLSVHSETEVVAEGFKYADILMLENIVRRVVGDRFEVDFRKTAMEAVDKGRSYNICHATPNAWAYISADGNVWSCSAYLGDQRFYLGNIYEHSSFKELWLGEKRRKHLEWMKTFAVNDHCRAFCRMHGANNALDSLKRGEIPERGERPGRVNFI